MDDKLYATGILAIVAIVALFVISGSGQSPQSVGAAFQSSTEGAGASIDYPPGVRGNLDRSEDLFDHRNDCFDGCQATYDACRDQCPSYEDNPEGHTRCVILYCDDPYGVCVDSCYDLA